MVEHANKDQFLSFLEKQGVRVDSLVEGAIEMAEEVHSGLVREDGKSSFLETHTWPVAMDMIKYYMTNGRNITGVEVASAILHDVMEDDERILNLYEAKSYGFDAYMHYRFGSRVYKIATELKIKPLENFPGRTAEDSITSRFWDYCDILLKADYDVKAIKLVDRLNNMDFIARVPGHSKTNRYLREAEDFYLAYTMIPPKMPEFYKRMRSYYEELTSQSKVVTV
jgi:(p)ppGpp synthase/HD superfamily hydrolase